MVESLGGACGGARGGGRRHSSSSGNNHRRHGTSYADAVSPHAPAPQHRDIPESVAPPSNSEWCTVQRRRSPPSSAAVPSPAPELPPPSLKRRRSPGASPTMLRNAVIWSPAGAAVARDTLLPPASSRRDPLAPLLPGVADPVPATLVHKPHCTPRPNATMARLSQLRPALTLLSPRPAPLPPHLLFPSPFRSPKTFSKLKVISKPLPLSPSSATTYV